jgi:GDP-L-fucose synthase
MQRDARIFVAGQKTLIGAAIVRRLEEQGFCRLCNRSDEDPNLADAAEVQAYFRRNQPEYVFHAAGRSGGIGANVRMPADLMLDNLLTGTHVIQAAHDHGVKRLLFLASSCSYPREAAQPLAVSSLLTGPLEPTNEAYAVAKIAGIKLCQAYRRQYGDDFVVGIPTNAFGPGDDFSRENSHVIAALVCKMHAAKTRDDQKVVLWGTGAARREFIYVDDLADACITVLSKYAGDDPINLGGGPMLSIRELAQTIRRIVGFTGELEFDASHPDGMPVKGLESSQLLALGWTPKTSFDDALTATYRSYLQSPECQEVCC